MFTGSASLGKRARKEDSGCQEETKKQKVAQVEQLGMATLNDIEEVWKKLEVQGKCKLNESTGSDALEKLEKRFKIILPVEFKALYTLHDGQQSQYGLCDDSHVGLFGDGLLFLSISDIIDITEECEEDVAFTDEEIKIENGWKFKTAIVFAYDYQEEGSTLYALNMFEKDGEYAYDIVLKHLQESEDYSISLGYGENSLEDSSEERPIVRPRKIQFQLWLQAYARYVSELEDFAKFDDLSHTFACFQPGEGDEIGFWRFHIESLKSQNKSARK